MKLSWSLCTKAPIIAERLRRGRHIFASHRRGSSFLYSYGQSSNCLSSGESWSRIRTISRKKSVLGSRYSSLHTQLSGSPCGSRSGHSSIQRFSSERTRIKMSLIWFVILCSPQMHSNSSWSSVSTAGSSESASS